MAADAYSRKPSSEEAREGYLLILKDKLGFFPAVGEPFDIFDGTDRRHVTVEAEHCECRGPELPHEHYKLRLPGLEKGRAVTIRPDGDAYRLER